MRLTNPANYLRYASEKLYYSSLNASREHIISQVRAWDAVNLLMSDLLCGDAPFLVARMGGIETMVCWCHLRKSFLRLRVGSVYGRALNRAAAINAGIAAPDDRSLDRFSSVYLGAIPFADVLGVWNVRGMYEIVERLRAPNATFTDLAALEPWQAHKTGKSPWTKALESKRVLVIHPFARSIEAQYARRAEIKTTADILPRFDLQTLMPPITFAGCSNQHTWEFNFQRLAAAVGKHSFDVALVGCGAYGLPIAAFIKQLGRQAIHLGGAIQLLFGIRGNRWEQRDFFAELMDDTWVRPLESERPGGANTVENACYW
jgi:hypothetical protein